MIRSRWRVSRAEGEHDAVVAEFGEGELHLAATADGDDVELLARGTRR